MVSIVQEIEDRLGPGSVLHSSEARARARNYWDSSPLQALALVFPRSTAEVSVVMRLCHARGQTVVVHGGLTGVCDGDRSTLDDVVLSLERMNKVDEIDTVGRTVTVQAGCTLQALQAAVERQGLFFPLDLGARGSCTVGGNIATNAGGTNVIRFGMMRALVLGLEAVLPDGTIISSMNHMLKNNTGYDLKQLFIGSEGTLGVVARAVLTLKEQSVSTSTVLVALDDGTHLSALLKLTDRFLGGALTSFEAMWGAYYRGVTEAGWHRSPMDRSHAFYVIIEADGASTIDEASPLEAAIELALNDGLIVDAVLPKSEAERNQIWRIREDFEALRQHKPLFLYDVSLPLRKMVEYVDGVTSNLRRVWPASQCYALGHIGDGNIHFFIAPNATGQVADLHSLCDECVYRPLHALHGAVSAEHGIGLEKKMWMPVSRSESEIELMRVIKRALDPQGILNRGKVIDI